MTEFLLAIHNKTLETVKEFKKKETELIEDLIEIDSHKVFLHLGYSSLFQYCVNALKLTEAQSYQFIGVARKSVEIPEIKVAIEAGRINVSSARRIVSVITPENKELWIEKASTLKQRDLEREIIKENPREFKRESIRPIAENRLELKVAINIELETKLKKIQDLLSQKISKACSLEEAIDYLASEYLSKKDPVQKAEKILSRQKPNSKPQIELSSRIVSPKRPPRLPIPAKIKHEVNLRDKNQCTYKGSNHSRCENSRWLHIHHVKPVAEGGDNTTNNLTTLCSAHHRYLHEESKR
jgi:hypothetical protein